MTCRGRAHASFTFVVDHSMFRDVAHRPGSDEFPYPYISHVEPVGMYEKKGGRKAKERPSCLWCHCSDGRISMRTQGAESRIRLIDCARQNHNVVFFGESVPVPQRCNNT